MLRAHSAVSDKYKLHPSTTNYCYKLNCLFCFDTNHTLTFALKFSLKEGKCFSVSWREKSRRECYRIKKHLFNWRKKMLRERGCEGGLQLPVVAFITNVFICKRHAISKGGCFSLNVSYRHMIPYIFLYCIRVWRSQSRLWSRGELGEVLKMFSAVAGF